MNVKERIIDTLTWVRLRGFNGDWVKKAEIALFSGAKNIGFESVEYSPEFNQALEELLFSGDIEYKAGEYWNHYRISDEKYYSYIQEPQFIERL